MRIHGLYFMYHGSDWKNSSDMKWSIIFLDESEKITAKKIGSRKLFGSTANIYSCNQCPHTFYAD